MKSKFFLCFRPIVEDSVLHNHAVDQSSSSIITKRREKNDQLFEPKCSRQNRRDKFFKALKGQSRKPEKMILKGNSNHQKEITSIGNLSMGNQSSRKSSYNHREATTNTSTSCDEIKKSSTSVNLIVFTLFLTIYFGRVYAIFLTSLWVLLFSLVPKSICRTLEKLFLAGFVEEKQSYNVAL
ncbi:uncharacterized protein LOC132029307 [Lycium ferocissimum]|uniref:uncharacterized protein LOC132029307 n=1 Tax=Lycium ferocissimum TaxID=112874 RepID=UPI002815097D|nr:uncharacterized protein LOC132029307 [Lycium ferocissimum]